MSLKIKLIRNGLLRGVITALIMATVTFFTVQNDASQLRSMVAVSVIAVAVAACTVIYDYDVWGVKKKIIIHTIAMLLTVYPALLLSGWFDIRKPSGYLTVLLSFAVFGIVFASIGYFVSKYIFKNVPADRKEK